MVESKRYGPRQWCFPSSRPLCHSPCSRPRCRAGWGCCTPVGAYGPGMCWRSVTILRLDLRTKTHIKIQFFWNLGLPTYSDISYSDLYGFSDSLITLKWVYLTIKTWGSMPVLSLPLLPRPQSGHPYGWLTITAPVKGCTPLRTLKPLLTSPDA